jgi:hypothetical protein
MTTMRLNAEERKIWARKAATGNKTQMGAKVYSPEPGLGTVRQRLDIIIQRQGGRVRSARMTEEEREDYRFWLRQSYLNHPPAL